MAMKRTDNVNIAICNHHVPYLAMMSKIPNINLVTLSYRFKGRDWNTQYRNKPINLIHIPIDEISLMDFYISIIASCKKIVLQSFDDLEIFCNEKSKFYSQIQSIPKIFLFHNSSYTEFGLIPQEQRIQKIQELHRIFMANNIRPVFISEFKKQSWGMEGTVILPGIDTSEFVNSWTGRNNKIVFKDSYDNFVLRVCSNFEHRDFMNGYKIGNNVLSQLRYPNVVLGEGNNPSERLPNTVFTISNNLEHYKEYLSMARFLFSANVPQFEDWYNLSSLEAVAVGTPLLMTYHNRQNNIPEFTKYFPIVSDDYNLLISEAKKLLMDWEYASHISKLQNGFIEKYFSLSAFITNWTKILS
jgi:hypothetical protein